MAARTKAQLKQFLSEKIRSNGVGGLTTALDVRQFEAEFIDSIWKVYEDLPEVARSGDYNDLTNKPSTSDSNLEAIYLRISSTESATVFVFPELIGFKVVDITRGTTLEVLKNDVPFSYPDQVYFDGSTGTLRFATPFSSTATLIRLLGTKSNGKLEQYLDFPALGIKALNSPDFSLNASINTGLPLTITSSNLTVAEIINGLVHIKAAGTTEITISQVGNTTYNSVSRSRTLTVVDNADNLAFTYVLPLALN